MESSSVSLSSTAILETGLYDGKKIFQSLIHTRLSKPLNNTKVTKVLAVILISHEEHVCVSYVKNIAYKP